MISIFSNSLGKEEHHALEGVFASRWLGAGKECSLFEEAFARHLRVPAHNVLLLNSCTAAIYVGLKTLGVGPGDEVIIATVNFVACASAVLELGATAVFADVDQHTLNILPEEISRLKTPQTKVVIILHYGGHPAPMAEIIDACGPEIALFEDSANSVSSTYDGQPCGTFGAAAVWSFDAMKILSMGDGGALYLRNPVHTDIARSHRFLGLSGQTVSGKDAMAANRAKWWEYELDHLSGRFISNDIAAAIGRVQLQRLSGFIETRKRIWAYYQQALADVSALTLPPEPLPGCESSYYFYWLQMAPDQRDALAHYLSSEGIYTTFRYFPLHLVARYNAGVQLPNAEWVNATTLNIPLHQNLTEADIDKIVAAIKTFFASLA
ncbi:MAG: DegT/DnrJ/EryC1/StrS family aminotransferase [Sphingobacteriales bacterium]|nr:MAG: DegT/DnrJ/EryC1/StrS family aminotransferase [Sphingobacteriales bacterium]